MQLKLLLVHQNHGNIVHRLTFTLGNLTTSSVAHRTAISKVPKALSRIVGLLSHYTDDPLAGADGCSPSSSSASSGGASANSAAGAAAAAGAGATAAAGSGGSTVTAAAAAASASRAAAVQARVREDCLVKLLRLVANLATQRELGEWLSGRTEVRTNIRH